MPSPSSPTVHSSSPSRSSQPAPPHPLYPIANDTLREHEATGDTGKKQTGPLNLTEEKQHKPCTKHTKAIAPDERNKTHSTGHAPKEATATDERSTTHGETARSTGHARKEDKQKTQHPDDKPQGDSGDALQGKKKKGRTSAVTATAETRKIGAVEGRRAKRRRLRKSGGGRVNQDGVRACNGIMVAGRGSDHRRTGEERSPRDVIGGDGTGSAGSGSGRAGRGLFHSLRATPAHRPSAPCQNRGRQATPPPARHGGRGRLPPGLLSSPPPPQATRAHTLPPSPTDGGGGGGER